MKSTNRIPQLLAIVVLIASLTGCSSTGGKTYKNLTMNFAAIQSVAVLPFQNLSQDDDAAQRVRDAFMGMLLATEAMYVLPPGEVQRGIERVQVRNAATPTVEELKKLGDVLGVEAIITGTIREYGTIRSGQSEASLISMSLQMLEVETGSIIWSGSSTKGGITTSDRLFGGGGQPMNEVTTKALNDLLDQLFQ